MVDWKPVVGSVAPVIAAGLTGPVGGLIAAVAGRVLLDKETASPAEVRDFVVANQKPEVFEKLKRAEAEVETTLAKLGIEKERILLDREKLAADDRASARARETALKDRTPTVLAYLLTVGFFALLGVMAFVKTPGENQAVLNIMLGALGTGWVTVLTYYFGSSAGSAQKSETLADIAKTVPPVPAPATTVVAAANANDGRVPALVSARPSRAAGTA